MHLPTNLAVERQFNLRTGMSSLGLLRRSAILVFQRLSTLFGISVLCDPLAVLLQDSP